MKVLYSRFVEVLLLTGTSIYFQLLQVEFYFVSFENPYDLIGQPTGMNNVLADGFHSLYLMFIGAPSVESIRSGFLKFFFSYGQFIVKSFSSHSPVT